MFLLCESLFFAALETLPSVGVDYPDLQMDNIKQKQPSHFFKNALPHLSAQDQPCLLVGFHLLLSLIADLGCHCCSRIKSEYI